MYGSDTYSIYHIYLVNIILSNLYFYYYTYEAVPRAQSSRICEVSGRVDARSLTPAGCTQLNPCRQRDCFQEQNPKIISKLGSKSCRLIATQPSSRCLDLKIQALGSAQRQDAAYANLQNTNVNQFGCINVKISYIAFIY